MKKIIISPRFISFILFTGLFILGCTDLKNLDPIKDIKLILNYKPADAFIEVQVKDAKNGQLVLDNINIEIIGKQSANVINFEGDAKTTYSKKGPSVYLGVRNLTPSDKNPVNFKIIISANGYLSSSKEVSLTNVSNAPVEIFLVKTSSLPTGAATQESSFSSAAGTGTNQEKVIEIQNGQNSTIVKIDKGTILKDSKGNVITGTIQAAFTTFTGNTKESAKALPLGNFVTLDKGPAGESNVNATILPIAFASIELKNASGTKVTSFNQPIDILFEINPNTINPKTKKKYNTGDKISILSYSETSATWTYEKEGLIIQKGLEYFVTFTTNHLTWYAASEYWSTVNSNSSVPGADNTIEALTINLEVTNQVPSSSSSFSTTNSISFDCELISGGVPVLWRSGFLSNLDGKSTYSYIFNNLPTIVEKLVLKIDLDGDGNKKVFEIINLNTFAKIASYKIEASRKPSRLKTIFANIKCSNDCPVEINSYNVGIEGNYDIANTTTSSTWNYLGAVNKDESGVTKLTAFLQDNQKMIVRAVTYPQYIQEINTGPGDSFIVPILIPADNKLCQCGK